MCLLARVVFVSRFDVALPFLVGGALLLISSFTGIAITQRLERVLNEWFTEEGIDVPSLGVPQDPASLASTAAWTVDAAQILAVVLGPLIGLLILRPHLGGNLSFVYLVSFVVGIAAFFGFTFRVRADKYSSITWLGVLTPVGAIGLALNLVAAAVAAWVVGPQ
jgi:hypothetical protein